MKKFILLILIVLFFCPSLSWASGALGAIRQRQQIEQEAYQQAVAQEYVRRQQEEMVAQYKAAYEQAAVQQYIQAQQQAIAAQIVQKQAIAQYQAQQMAQEMAAYQAAVLRRQQMMAQEQVMQIKVVQNAQFQQVLMNQQAQQYAQQVVAAQMVAAQQQQNMAEYQQALLAREIGQKAAYEQVQAVQVAQAARGAQEMAAYQAASFLRDKNQNNMYEDIPSSFVKDVVPVTELWASLDKSSKAWPLIIDKKAKGTTISHYMEKLAKEGGKISQDPLHYAQLIDDISYQNPTMLQQPFMDVLRIIAIIEYDYDNGMDKDLLARKIFPNEQAFQNNKKRLGK